jgi:hypothetical protein
MKAWYKSRTIWLNSAVLATAVLSAMSTDPVFAAHAKEITMVLAFLNIVLRVSTTDKIGKE